MRASKQTAPWCQLSPPLERIPKQRPEAARGQGTGCKPPHIGVQPIRQSRSETSFDVRGVLSTGRHWKVFGKQRACGRTVKPSAFTAHCSCLSVKPCCPSAVPLVRNESGLIRILGLIFKLDCYTCIHSVSVQFYDFT